MNYYFFVVVVAVNVPSAANKETAQSGLGKHKLTPVCLGAATSQAVCEWLFCNKCKAAGAVPLGSRGE